MRDIQAKSPHVRQKRYPCHAANKIKDHKKRAIIVNIGMRQAAIPAVRTIPVVELFTGHDKICKRKRHKSFQTETARWTQKIDYNQNNSIVLQKRKAVY